MADFAILAGGGRNTQARAADVHEQECADGENFELRLFDSRMRARKPFDHVGTATNTSEIRGFAQLEKADGTIATLVQSGTTVYAWDLESSFISKGSVSASMRMRGTATFALTDKVLITDLNKAQVVMEYDGATFQAMPHNLGGNLYAKYAIIENERAIFANVKTSIDTPHVLLGSKAGDNEILTVTDKPSSALSNDDPWFIPVADFRPLNGIVHGIGSEAGLIMSSENGRIRKLAGTSAQDFAVLPFFVGSAAAGDEALVNTRNDIVFGRPGAIESLSGVQQFGDVITDDLSRWIGVKNISSWKIYYDPDGQRVFCFPKDGSEIHVLYKEMLGAPVSPWSKWTTTHSMAFQPTAVAALKRPDGTTRIFMGDGSGKLYMLDGVGSQDGGSADVTAFRDSFIKKSRGDINTITGYVDYLKTNDAQTITLDFKFGGITQVDLSETITVPALTTSAVYGTTAYYGTTSTYGPAFKGRFARQGFSVSGSSNGIQVRSTLTGSAEIDEIWVKYSEAEPF